MGLWTRLFSRSALVVVSFVTTGCLHFPVNESLASYEEKLVGGHRFQRTPLSPNTHSLFICLAFSGGGTRAAALAYGVLEKLRATRITWEGHEKSLLDEVDCISSVSGGSFTAAYYGLFGDRLFDDFRARFLERNVQRELMLRAINPVNLLAMISPSYSRSDLAATLYDESLFDHKTFADFSPGRPFVILNATNIATGERFEFTQDQFDFLGSNLSAYPVARAVAASSAFPILLSPITLFNHQFPVDYRIPHEVENALADRSFNRRRFVWGKNQLAYLDKKKQPYVHLIDGGIADNIGLRAIEGAQALTSGFLRRLLNQGIVERVVLIVVNARTEPVQSISQHEGPPGAPTVMYRSATIPMDHYSFETIESKREANRRDEDAERSVEQCLRVLESRCPASPPMPLPTRRPPVHIVEVNFEAIEDPNRREAFLNLPTSFALTGEQVQALVDVAKELLDQSQDFQELLQALRGTR